MYVCIYEYIFKGLIKKAIANRDVNKSNGERMPMQTDRCTEEIGCYSSMVGFCLTSGFHSVTSSSVMIIPAASV